MEEGLTEEGIRILKEYEGKKWEEWDRQMAMGEEMELEEEGGPPPGSDSEPEGDLAPSEKELVSLLAPLMLTDVAVGGGSPRGRAKFVDTANKLGVIITLAREEARQKGYDAGTSSSKKQLEEVKEELEKERRERERLEKEKKKLGEGIRDIIREKVRVGIREEVGRV